MIVWQDQRILETVTDTDGLIAHWQPVGLNGIGREVGKQVESVRGKAVEKTGDAVERMKGWFNPDPQTP